MPNATKAYETVAGQIASPRELEARLLRQAALRLQAVSDTSDRSKSELHEALLFNRKLWTIFLTSATSSDNPLPVAVRQDVANLGLFVMKQTIATLADPRPEQFNSLVNINREVAAGLLAHA